MLICGDGSGICCRLVGTSESLKPAMMALLADPTPHDPVYRAETAFDFWHIRQVEYFAEGDYASAFAMALVGGLGHDGFEWGEQHIHLEDEPVGLLCSTYGAEKLVNEQYQLMQWVGLLPQSVPTPSETASGPMYLAGQRLSALIKENPQRGVLSFLSARQAEVIAGYLCDHPALLADA